MKQVHMGGYSVVIPDGYVHNVKVSRMTGSQDVMILPTNDTPVIVGFDIIKQGFFSLEPSDLNLLFHFDIR